MKSSTGLMTCVALSDRAAQTPSGTLSTTARPAATMHEREGVHGVRPLADARDEREPEQRFRERASSPVAQNASAAITMMTAQNGGAVRKYSIQS